MIKKFLQTDSMGPNRSEMLQQSQADKNQKVIEEYEFLLIKL